MTYEEMKAAVDAFYGDQSRSRSETRDGLETLVEEIKVMLDTLDD